jgi:GntR family transcriptional repressor for pyruvate dehydrogenase complex
MPGPVVPLAPKKDTLSAQVTRYVMELIARDKLEPGALVPSEVQICRDLNVSRGIVREAYRALSTLGVLETEAGKVPRFRGMNSVVLQQVFGFALKTAHVTALEILQLRRSIEVCAARLAAQKGSPAQFQRLRQCVCEMRSAGADHDRLIMADVMLHTTLAEATGNPLFKLMIEGLRGPLEDSMAQGLKSRRTRDEVLRVPDLHDAIVSSILARDGDGAAQAMAHHFDLSVAAILTVGMAAAPSEGAGQKKAARRGWSGA